MGIHRQLTTPLITVPTSLLPLPMRTPTVFPAYTEQNPRDLSSHRCQQRTDRSSTTYLPTYLPTFLRHLYHRHYGFTHLQEHLSRNVTKLALILKRLQQPSNKKSMKSILKIVSSTVVLPIVLYRLRNLASFTLGLSRWISYIMASHIDYSGAHGRC